VEVPTLAPDLLLKTPPGESTRAIRERCVAARARALARQGMPNQGLQGKQIDAHAQLDDAGAKFLTLAAARLAWSARATHRALKVARTIADLDGADGVAVGHVAEAVQYRRALAKSSA
jgi:magnesium chelatase family protein